MNSTNEKQNQKSEPEKPKFTKKEFEAHQKKVRKAIAKHQKRQQQRHLNKMNNNPLEYEEERKNSV